jgi:streptogrisin C
MKAENSKVKRNHQPHFCLFAAALVLCMARLLYGQSESRPQVAASEDVIVQQNASAYYAKKYRVDVDEAERRLAIQDRAAGIEDDIAKALRAQYSGIWYDHADGGKLKIGMTPAAMKRADEVRRIARRYGVVADMDLVTVRFTQAELEQKQSLVRKRIADMVDAGHARTAYNTKANKAIVTALAKLPPREEARVKGLTGISGVTVRRVDLPTLRGKLLACNVTYCNPPFRGGREIAGTGGCTAAFMARDRSNPNLLWAMTAGHCVFFGGTSWQARDESNNWGVVGSTAYYDFSGGPGRDAGKISIDSGGAWATPAPLPAVVVKSSSNTAADTTYNPNYLIKATSWSSIGQVLCRTGQTTGTECGEVSDLGADESSTGPDGKAYTFHNMGEIDVCGSQDGDSGGPLYKTHRAYGIVSSMGSGSCFEAYQGVRGAEGAMNVTVIVAP